MTGSMTPVRLTESVAHRVRRGQRTPRTPLPPDLRCSLPFRCHEACGTRFGVVAYMIIRSRCRLSFSLSLSVSRSLSLADTVVTGNFECERFSSWKRAFYTRWVVVTEHPFPVVELSNDNCGHTLGFLTCYSETAANFQLSPYLFTLHFYHARCSLLLIYNLFTNTYIKNDLLYIFVYVIMQ